MPPRIRLRPRALCTHTSPSQTAFSLRASYASLATAPSIEPLPATPHILRPAPPILRYPPTQPPSHKPADVRKSQLHRQYQSLLRSSPLILLFQHNNIKAVEWMSLRRELAAALAKVDAERAKDGSPELIGEAIRLQVLQTNIFSSALRVVEFFHPEEAATVQTPHPNPDTTNTAEDGHFTHGLSRRAWEVASNKKLKSELETLLTGPMAVVAFPSVAPQYLKAVLSTLAPSPDFPAPKRKVNPAYHEAEVQAGLSKLMLLGARVEGRVFDLEATKWVGGIDGGIDGLRAQLVAMLQGVGGSLASTLEGASRSLYFTIEGRRVDMEEKENPKMDGEKKDE
ncbi:hypothetical protein P154DRAFT_526936 [Amniculicola lignicola CBS 123094]|uniref:Uncharacterized protein n=1 Tax=Amniculicola lignicola CBS 123094 TaxID=1392246 RepID=A0A6A5W112_9PLEO|nr:hypothetical protein P154DRAFT_526936 [Amniculicola lignicola CBS 123094]